MLHRWRHRGRGRWLTEWQQGIESGSIGSQCCYQLTGLCNHITLGLWPGHSKHRDVKGLGLVRTACPKLVEPDGRVEHTVCRKLSIVHRRQVLPSHHDVARAEPQASQFSCWGCSRTAVQNCGSRQPNSGSKRQWQWQVLMWFFLPLHCYCCSLLKTFLFLLNKPWRLVSLCLNMSNEKK